MTSKRVQSDVVEVRGKDPRQLSTKAPDSPSKPQVAKPGADKPAKGS